MRRRVTPLSYPDLSRWFRSTTSDVATITKTIITTGLCYHRGTSPSTIPTTHQVPQERRRDSSSTSSNYAKPPLPRYSSHYYEVSCPGNLTIGDTHDHWVVEVVDDVRRGQGRESKQDPRYQVLGCYLSAANAVLPQGGFKQIEVNCVENNDPSDSHTYWNVQSHWNDRRTCNKLAHCLFSCARHAYSSLC